MRALLLSLLCLSCATGPELKPEPTQADDAKPAEAPKQAEAPKPPPPIETLSADTPKTTVEGAAFIAPAGWGIQVLAPATILTPPENDGHIALVDVKAKDSDAAVAAAWAAYQPAFKWPLKVINTLPDKDGWSDRKNYEYQTSPNEKRDVGASTRRAGDVWTVAIFDMAQGTSEKRIGGIQLVFGHLLPKGFTRENFAGKKANTLDKARIEQLTAFVEKAMKATKVPGVAIGLVDHGKVVFADGFGVRELGQKQKPDADTAFMIASNTKALTTLLLGKLVEEKKMTWDTPVTQLLPAFKLGDDEITRQVNVRHLICACTGLPRKDLEWLLEYGKMTPDGAMAALASVKPTSKFGEMFQYSNLMAGAAGFIGGRVLFPKLELGAAYDQAMAQRIFVPLGMKSTTFDYGKAMKGNHAYPHSHDVDGNPARAVMEANTSVIPLRPAGAAWSTVKDMLQYVQMELNEGVLPNGKRFIAKEPLLERRVPQVPIGKDETYGMGLEVNTKYGTPVVHHGGDLIGFHSDMMWLPEAGVGAVVLTNADPGWQIRTIFRRKLLEVLYDGHPEADADIEAQAKAHYDQLAAERKLLTVPADEGDATRLAAKYRSDALGEVAVSREKGVSRFDFGEWKSDVASRKNPDGTVTFVTISPGVQGFELTVGAGAKRTLVLRDAQHEYVFNEVEAPPKG